MTSRDHDCGRLSLDHPLLEGLRGRGVRVAVIDSGVTPGHPHLPEIRRGLSVDTGGKIGADFRDRIGHGTAVAAVIHEKAPEADLLPVRIFESSLTASPAILIVAIDAAVERGAVLVNLSLGTPNLEHEPALRACVERAVAVGARVVSPSRHRSRRWLPGSIGGAVGVELDWALERHEILWDPEARAWRACGYPRPVAGVPREGNLQGISFAAANVSGLLARGLEDPRFRDRMGWPVMGTGDHGGSPLL